MTAHVHMDVAMSLRGGQQTVLMKMWGRFAYSRVERQCGTGTCLSPRSAVSVWVSMTFFV